jgi:type IV secretory pathway VirB3-like protein
LISEISRVRLSERTFALIASVAPLFPHVAVAIIVISDESAMNSWLVAEKTWLPSQNSVVWKDNAAAIASIRQAPSTIVTDSGHSADRRH